MLIGTESDRLYMIDPENLSFFDGSAVMYGSYNK